MTDTTSLVSPHVQVPVEEIREFCERNHIQLFAFFGSVLRDDFGEDSDVDVLIEFEPDNIPGLQFFAMQEELSRILGREVDLNTLGFLSAHMRETVQDEALIQFVKS
jgi:predicted nucleotidyltransferase